jgi:hypothetical protein
VTENRLLLVGTHEGRYALDRTLDKLERLLPPRRMGEIRLDTGDQVPISRDHMANPRRRLGG